MSSDHSPASARTRRSLAARIGVPAVLLVAGALLALLADGVAAILGAGLIGVAAVLVIANVFYEVGRSEDRERERAAARRARTTPSPNGRGEADAGRAGRLAPPRDWPPRGRRGPHE